MTPHKFNMHTTGMPTFKNKKQKTDVAMNDHNKA